MSHYYKKELLLRWGHRQRCHYIHFLLHERPWAYNKCQGLAINLQGLFSTFGICHIFVHTELHPFSKWANSSIRLWSCWSVIFLKFVPQSLFHGLLWGLRMPPLLLDIKGVALTGSSFTWYGWPIRMTLIFEKYFP